MRVGVAVMAWWALAFLPTPASGLDPLRRLADYTHQTWTVDEGLPQDAVTAVRQTRDGYLWVATLDGLARFDGLRFEIFNLIQVADLESNVVTALGEGRDGSVWIGTTSGLVQYVEGRFDVLTGADGLSDDAVRTLVVDRAGIVWVGTRWGGLNRVAGQTVTTWTTGHGLRHADVRALAEDAAGTLWVGTAAGLHRLAGDRVVPVPMPGEVDAPLVLALHVDRRGALWIGTTTGLWAVPATGLTLGDGATVAATLVLRASEVRALAEDDDGNMWVGLSEGMARVRGANVDLESTAPGVPRRFVRALALDAEGSLWIGTDGEGLWRWRDASVVMRPVGSADASISAVFRDRNGQMWAGGNCTGVATWTREGDIVTYTPRDGLPNHCVRTFAEGRDGALWIGTADGLARLHDGRLTRHTTADGLSSGVVMALLEDRHGVLWVGTNGSGVDRFVDGRFVNVGPADGLAHHDVRALKESRDGTIWIGTLGGGITLWRDGVVSWLTRAEGLSNHNILTLHEDPDGTVWIGTNGGGLNRYHDGRVTHYTTANGLPSDGVFQILDDGRGSLWMSSNRGIFRVTRQDLDDVAEGRRADVRALRFGRPEGLGAAGAMGGSQSAGAVDASGRLWFPTIAGIAIIDPGTIRPNTAPPPVHIVRLTVDRAVVSGAALGAIPPGARAVEIDYTAPSFVAPSEVLFRYRLTGFSDEWVDAGTRRAAHFTNLRPGRYRFHVQAANNDGVWNDEGAAVDFVLRPRFYQTAWFAASIVLTVAAGLWGGLHVRERRVAARQRELGAQVEQAMARIKVLSGLLPICASCKRIRDDGNQWKALEAYIEEHSQADFTHGICPECLERIEQGETS